MSDGRNICEALVEGLRAEWTLARGCRCGSCRTFKLIDWDDKTVVEHEDQRGFLDKVAKLISARSSP